MDNIEQRFNKYENDLSFLQNRLYELEKQPQTPNNASINQKPQTYSTPRLPFLYVNCRGPFTGDIMNEVSSVKDDGSIFQIDPNNGEITVMDVVDATLYQVVINSISNLWQILKPIGHPQLPQVDTKKIITDKAGKVKKISDTQWQIVDKQLIEVKFV